MSGWQKRVSPPWSGGSAPHHRCLWGGGLLQSGTTLPGGSLTERYNAPDNISVHCNESHCLIRWQQPRTRQPRSSREFQYQLDVQRWVSGLGSEQASEPRGAWQAAPPPDTKERAGGVGVGGDPGSAARPPGPRVDTGEPSETWLPRLSVQKKAASLCYTSPGTQGLEASTPCPPGPARTRDRPRKPVCPAPVQMRKQDPSTARPRDPC